MELMQRVLELLERLLGKHFSGRIVRRRLGHYSEHVLKLGPTFNVCLAHGVLMSNVLSHCEQVGFWRSDGLVIGNPEHAQIDFLDQIGNIGAELDPPPQEAPQMAALAGHQRRYESLTGSARQLPIPRADAWVHT
jgi:hypothetical protein